MLKPTKKELKAISQIATNLPAKVYTVLGQPCRVNHKRRMKRAFKRGGGEAVDRYVSQFK